MHEPEAMHEPEEIHSHEFHTKMLIQHVSKNFDGPIYRGVEDLEAVRNSDSPTVAVVAEDQPMIFYVSRETFLNEKVGMEADDLFEHAGVL